MKQLVIFPMIASDSLSSRTFTRKII